MKTILQKLFFVTSMLLCVTNATAYDFEADGIYYNILSETEKTVEVTYRIYLYDYDKYSDGYTGSVIIPATVNYKNVTYSVTSIGVRAFNNCTRLTSITIPNSVTNIGNYAFNNCTGLTSIEIPNSVTSIGDYAFCGCTGLTSITIPNSVTSIGVRAFNGCKGLTSITIPNSVTSIGIYVFEDCTNLTNVTIGNSVTNIGNYAFYNCTGLTSVTIGNSVTSIGVSAFFGCDRLYQVHISDLAAWCGIDFKDVSSNPLYYAHNLYLNGELVTELVIPYGVNEIKKRAFYGCTGLTSITIPNSVTSIGDGAFDGCTRLKTVVNFSNLTFTKGSYYYGYIAYHADNVYNAPNGSIEEDYIFGKPNEVNTLLYYLGNRNELNLPVDYKGENYVIGDNVFKNYTTLTSVTIPNSVTSIGNYAFNGCKGLTSITIPNSVTSIGIYAFEDCTNLTNVTIGNSVTSIGERAFDGCSELKEVHISDLAAWCGIDFKDVSSNPLYYAHNLYLNDELVSELVIPYGVNEIKKRAFYGCTGLTSVTIPFRVTSIGVHAFHGCTGLTSITIPNSVTSIGNYAFYNCTGLTSITIPNSVTSIGDDVFYGCSGLTSITIPNSVTSIGYEAFRYCTGLKEVHISDLAAWCGIDFEYDDSNPLYYAHNLYLNGELVTELVIPDGINEIKQYAFYSCTRLTGITIPSSVTSIGKSAFRNCTGLTNVTIPNSVRSIGNYAFEDCTRLKEVHISDLAAWCGIDFKDVSSNPLYYAHNLYLNGELVTELVIPDGINEIKQYAFYNCTGLTNVTIPNSVTSIGNYAFYNCTGLTSITIPNSVTSIGDDVFYGCTGLTSVTIPNSVTSIGDGAFRGCSGLASVTIGNSVTSIGESAFYGCTGLKTVVNFSNFTFTKGSSDYGYIAYYADNVYNAPNGSIEEDCVFCKPNEVNTLVGYLGSAMELTLPGNYKGEDYIIGAYALRGCSGLTSITIPNSVISIEESAFEGCTELESVTIGNSVRSIGGSAFNGCNNVMSIYNFSEKAITCSEDIFSTDTYNNATLYVPRGRIAAYSRTTPWNSFYIEEMKEFNITYIVDGKEYMVVKVEYGATIEPLEEPTKEGHTFSGWSEIPETMPAEDVTITGSFTANNYIVTFMIDGEVYDTATVEYGTEIELPTPPEKEGYTFSGWVGVPETMPAEDITITGSFTINSYILTYIVDGEVYATDSIAYGATIEPLEEPTKEGHTFSGWSEIPETMPAEDITITGSFTINSYILTYIVDGEVYATDSIAYGATIEPLEEPTKEGHTFSGWSEIPETMPAEDITITGSFTINSYILTYIVDGEVYATDSIAYGATIEPLEEPTKEGHTFSGWSEIPETMPAEDITITGSFTANNYIVTFMIDGEVYDTATVEYGTEIELPTPPEKEGYIFSGWVGVPETMPAEDIVIEGSYEVDTTGINAIELDLERNEVYNLNGLRITETENLSRGFYIINGKKVYVK